MNRWLALGRAVQPLGERRQLYIGRVRGQRRHAAARDPQLLRHARHRAAAAQRAAHQDRVRASSRPGIGGLAQAEADYYQDLIDPQELAPQRAPNLRAEHALPLLGNRFVGRLAGQVTNFQRNEGFDGFRGDVAPGAVPALQPRARAERLGHGPRARHALPAGRRPAGGAVVPNDTASRRASGSRRRPRGSRSCRRSTRRTCAGCRRCAAGSATEMARVYDFPHLGLQKLRHSIEPIVSLPVRPARSTRTSARIGAAARARKPACLKFARTARDVPGAEPELRRFCNATLFSRGYLFDELDAINRRSFFSYGFTMRLLGRFGGARSRRRRRRAAPDDDEEWADVGRGADRRRRRGAARAG